MFIGSCYADLERCPDYDDLEKRDRRIFLVIWGALGSLGHSPGARGLLRFPGCPPKMRLSPLLEVTGQGQGAVDHDRLAQLGGQDPVRAAQRREDIGGDLAA